MNRRVWRHSSVLVELLAAARTSCGTSRIHELSCLPCCRSSSRRTFSAPANESLRVREGDVVILEHGRRTKPIFTRPLKQDDSTNSHLGTIQHNDIIGKEFRDVATTTKGQKYRILPVTLAEYVTMTRRRVTPIYPTEANLIVSLLDIHVSSIPPDTETLTPPPLEILEAGTGHGSLTLHLARAIHAANQPPPQLPGSFENEEEYEHHIRPWKENRRAIVHTIDLDQAHSNHARQIVRDFRRRLYSHHVDFHVGDVSEWLNREMASRQETSFLSYCLLDLPAAHDHLSTVAQALKTHGIVTAFNPSITQIAECVRTIRDLRLPLVLEKVVELGAGAGTGGRQWDVRIAKVRHPGRQKKKQVIQASSDGSSGAKSTHPGDVTEDDLSSNILSDLPRGAAEGVENPVSDLSDDQDASPTSDELPDMSISSEAAGTPERTEMVCRPTVGNMVVGGGFLGVWRKMRKGDVLDDP